MRSTAGIKWQACLLVSIAEGQRISEVRAGLPPSLPLQTQPSSFPVTDKLTGFCICSFDLVFSRSSFLDFFLFLSLRLTKVHTNCSTICLNEFVSSLLSISLNAKQNKFKGHRHSFMKRDVE